MKPEVTRFDGGEAPRLVVAGASAINSLAFTPWQLWAFLRAEQTAFAETPFRCANGARATMATLRTLHPRASGVERLVPLAGRLLDELVPMLVSAPPELRVALVLCLPSRMGDAGAKVFRGQRRVLEEELGGRLAEAQEARGGEAPLVRALPLGHAAMAHAVRELGAAMARGLVDVAFVGGVDTAYDTDYVEELLAQERLFDGENLAAPLLGEGGAFLALATLDAAAACRWPRLAQVAAVATGREPATVDNDVPTMGLGLSRCAVAATDHLEAEGRTLDWWISDMTAEPLRVQEFQLAWPRASARRMRPDSTLDFPASQLGDLGAAVMPTAVALAVEGFARRAPAADTCLVTGSSDGGERGVLLLERAR